MGALPKLCFWLALPLLTFGLFTAAGRWKTVIIARLETGRGDTFVICAETGWQIDPMRIYYCKLRHGGRTVAGYLMFAHGEANSFELRISKDGHVAALIERSRPDDILLMADLTNFQIWWSGSWSADPAPDPSWLARLRDAYPKSNLALHDARS